MRNIVCENYLCAYFFNGVCRLESINLSVAGLCSSCIYIDIDETYLRQQREKLLKLLENPNA